MSHVPGMIYARLFLFCAFFSPWVFFHSRVTGTCPVTMDLIMRVNLRTTATTATTTTTTSKPNGNPTDLQYKSRVATVSKKIEAFF